MGETAKLNTPLAGQFSLNDFLAQQNNDVTPREILRTIVPVQEMRDFQRRYLFDTRTQALFAGERISLLRWEVPANEWWKPLRLLYGHFDSITHSIIITFTMSRNDQIIRYVPVRTTVDAGLQKVVYGAHADGTMQSGLSNTGRYISTIPVTMEPGDLFTLVDETSNAGASVAQWVFVYERVPQPATQRTPGVVGAVTVVP